LSLLRVESISKVYGKRTVVKDVSFEVGKGEIVGLLGPNGAGKTTAFKVTVGLIKPKSGRVYFNGIEVTRMPMYKRARLGIGYLPQEASIFRKLTVEENILAILETLDISSRIRQNRLKTLLDELELMPLAKNRADTLSGGERRRLEITRALVTEPDLILLDEPFSGVDPMAVFDIQSIIRKLRGRGISILLTDHSVREILAVTDRAYIISSGTVLRHGKPEELVHDDLVRKIYLGEQFQADGIIDVSRKPIVPAEPITVRPSDPARLARDFIFADEGAPSEAEDVVTEDTFRIEDVDGADLEITDIETEIQESTNQAAEEDADKT